MSSSCHSGAALAPLRPTSLEVLCLSVGFEETGSGASVLHEVSLRARAGQVHALVGASGSGKSTMLNALAGSLPPGARVSGSLALQPADGGASTVPMVRAGSKFDALPPTPVLAGRTIAVIPQSAATALTPVRTVGSQLAEVCRALGSALQPEALLRLAALRADVLSLYPHELSGGMAQRVAAAFAFAGNAPVILADEPTAALDPDLTATMLRLLRRHADRGGTVILVTHDIEELERAGIADTVSVLHGGRLVESGEARQVLDAPRDVRTKRLLQALPSRAAPRMPAEPGRPARRTVLSVQGATVTVGTAHSRRVLFRDVDLQLRAGELVGISGPSGAGKSTLVRVMSGLQAPDSGAVLLGTTPVRDVRTSAAGATRGRIGVVFQSPRAAMDPRLSLSRSIGLALREADRRAAAAGGAANDTVGDRARAMQDFAHAIGLTPEVLARRPREVSDGQLQRAALVRVAAQQPEVVLCDEITAALDPVASAAVMTALRRLSELTDAAVVVVSHDAALLGVTVDRIESIGQWDGSSSEASPAFGMAPAPLPGVGRREVRR